MAARVIQQALQVCDLTVRYGGVTALHDVNVTVNAGEVVGLIGPNGAGKTSLLNAASGLAPVSAGSVLFAGRDIGRLPAHRIARAGVVRTYQNVRLFRTLAVEDNIRAGAFAARTSIDSQRLNAVLRRTGLHDVDPRMQAGRLPYGAQRRLEIARALASSPSMLLLDEPAAGMGPQETAQLAGLIGNIAVDGIGVLLVEHDMQLVSDVCNRVAVLNFGMMLAQGTPAEIGRNPAVVEAYLGTGR